MSGQKLLTFAAVLALGSWLYLQLTTGNTPHTCLSADEANGIANIWLQLIGNYSQELAETTLAANFTDYSASALSLDSVCPQVPGQPPPLGSPVFTNRSSFEAGQGSQPPLTTTPLDIVHSCKTVTMRYTIDNTGSRPVYAVILMDAIKATAGSNQPFLIEKIFSEFDSAAWVANLQDSGRCNSSTTSGSIS